MATAKKSAATKSSGTQVTKQVAKQVKVTLIKSLAGQLQAHQATVRGLGLRRIRASAVVTLTPQISGMLQAAHHMLKVEQA
jgi:large subunit ribosomal protein L30